MRVADLPLLLESDAAPARLIAVLYAENTLPLFYDGSSGDERPFNAIAAAAQFSLGNTTARQLRAARLAAERAVSTVETAQGRYAALAASYAAARDGLDALSRSANAACLARALADGPDGYRKERSWQNETLEHCLEEQRSRK